MEENNKIKSSRLFAPYEYRGTSSTRTSSFRSSTYESSACKIDISELTHDYLKRTRKYYHFKHFFSHQTRKD